MHTCAPGFPLALLAVTFHSPFPWPPHPLFFFLFFSPLRLLGIGQGRVTDNMKGAKVDTAIHVPDEDSVRMVYHLLHEEGFCVGASSGLNVSAAVRVAEQMGPGHTIVSMICDNGLVRPSQTVITWAWALVSFIRIFERKGTTSFISASPFAFLKKIFLFLCLNAIPAV